MNFLVVAYPEGLGWRTMEAIRHHLQLGHSVTIQYIRSGIYAGQEIKAVYFEELERM